ncbi:putative zinc-binding metallopeptidase [Komagataeibacter sp. FNDCF1]|uniref:zinc-binding metallopeptidase family protein n=1 Tax=Komagataeibacter sp. FNDCF1 TaxID=2878681 RepID=UPI001E3DBA23|nr:putative zinc-binding peptidase [Komagataeibacter sp. FNDCF1]MCE2565684.1 putative zinc-binding peptidase [Komagataeibacter sp. FNDCF1]
MKLFFCQSCQQVLFFENTACERCGHTLGYLPQATELYALDAMGDGLWQPLGAPHAPRALCANNACGACNWLAEPGQAYCVACSFNRTIPNLSVPGNIARWQKLEVAKHRLFYTLLRLGLPMRNRREDPQNGLAFDFLDSQPDGTPAMTGHMNGIITIAMNETDDAQREKMRLEMGEYYRTLLGHFRHEIGHYYWNVLIRDAGPDRLAACRAVFGDDRQDYAASLQAHYNAPPSTDWRGSYVSHYATSHPWEDFAETWAHYLHIISTLETAWAYRISIDAAGAQAPPLRTSVQRDPYTEMSFTEITEGWLPLTYAVNSLNRSMGLPDFYPFVLTSGILRKLSFIHDLIRTSRVD